MDQQRLQAAEYIGTEIGSGPAASVSQADPTFQQATIDLGPEKYVPSPMDYSILVPQLIGMAFLAVCLAYYQFILAPSAQASFIAYLRSTECALNRKYETDDGTVVIRHTNQPGSGCAITQSTYWQAHLAMCLNASL